LSTKWAIAFLAVSLMLYFLVKTFNIGPWHVIFSLLILKVVVSLVVSAEEEHINQDLNVEVKS
jgi:hypothetical protein